MQLGVDRRARSFTLDSACRMDAARRVCENDSIILQILGYLDRPKLRRIATLERAFFQLAIRVLWRRIWVQELYSLLSGSVSQRDLYVVTLTMSALFSRLRIRGQTHHCRLPTESVSRGVHD